jgi:hypothetical protein
MTTAMCYMDSVKRIQSASANQGSATNAQSILIVVEVKMQNV